ncbi:MAG: sulfatase [Spirochaetaceae bacterium]|nr:MAG: sulfatase [Spirochaetaceae bacterium]
MKPGPANIVLVTAHDIGRYLGAYGVNCNHSPALDNFADDAICLTNFHSAAPQCSPSRAAFATGLYPHATGVLGICSEQFGFDMDKPERHIARMLGGAGYRTAGMGVAHETINPQAVFDRYEKTLDADAIASKASEYLFDVSRRGRPFFLQVGFRQAHRPFEDVPYDEYGVEVPPWLADTPPIRYELAAMQGAIRRMDRCVGEILQALDKNNLKDRTLVVFAADHGLPFARAKHSLYEPGCEAAAIIRFPERNWRGGHRVDCLVSGVDLFATLLDAAGVAPPDGIQGVNIAPVLDGSTTSVRDYVFTEQTYHAYLDCSRAVRDTRYKLIANFSPGRAFFDSSQSWRPKGDVRFVDDPMRTHHPPIELYDLQNDPLEQSNLATSAACSEIMSRLKGVLLKWMQDTDDPLLNGIPIPPIYWRAMRALSADGASNEHRRDKR